MFEELHAMPLDESCEIYLGRLLVVKPCEYSWGWRLADSSGDDDDI